jgi:hypothetical protein
MGVKIKRINEAWMVPLDDRTPYFEVIRTLQDMRAKTPKDSLENLVIKLILNAIYGLCASGINPKTRTELGSTKSVKAFFESQLSSPFCASYTTSMVRAVMCEHLYKVNLDGGMIISITTDGFLCNIHPDSITYPNDANMTRLLRKTRMLLSGDPAHMEIKHHCKDVINFAVRGQLALSHKDPSKLGLKAITGFQSASWDHLELHRVFKDAVTDPEN